MLVLGLESATPYSGVWLGREDGTVAGASLARAAAHGEFLAPAIEFCLTHAGLGIADVNGVAVDLGPGLFTGMRVGIATAQAIAHARRLPVVGLASLDLLAFPLRHARRDVVAVIDARRGELFWAFYRPVPGGMQRTTEFRLGRAETLAGEIEAAGGDLLAVGDGAVANDGLLGSAGAGVADHHLAYPSAQSLVELALPRFLREETERPEELRPHYLRTADASIGWRDRGALAGGKAPQAPDEPVSQPVDGRGGRDG